MPVRLSLNTYMLDGSVEFFFKEQITRFDFKTVHPSAYTEPTVSGTCFAMDLDQIFESTS